MAIFNTFVFILHKISKYTVHDKVESNLEFKRKLKLFFFWASENLYKGLKDKENYRWRALVRQYKSSGILKTK